MGQALNSATDLPARSAGGVLATLSVARLRELLSGEAGRARRIAGMAFAIRVASAGVTFLAQIVLARWMGGHEFGVYVIVWTWLLLAGDIVHLGIPLVAQRFIPEYNQSGQLDALRGFLAGGPWITFGLATGFAIAGAVLIHALSPVIDPDLVFPFYFACASLPFVSLSLMCDGLARTHNWIALALAPHSLLRPLVLFALLAAAALAGQPINATSAMLALAVATWSTSLLQLALVRRALAGVVPAGPARYEPRRWFATSLPILVVWSFYTMLAYADVLVLQQFRPPGEVAHYYAAVKTLMLVGFVHFSVSAAVAHRYTALHVAGDSAALAAFAAQTARWTFWPSLALTVVMLALGKPLLSLFGAGFADAWPWMFILAIGVLARASVGPAERLLTMVGQQGVSAAVYALALAVNVGVCALLAPAYGGAGAACATAAAIVLESTLLCLAVRRRLGVRMLAWGMPARERTAT